MPGMLKKAADFVSKLAILVFCGVIIWAGSVNVITALERGYRSSSLLGFPMWVPYILIPVGGVLLLMATIYLSLKDKV